MSSTAAPKDPLVQSGRVREFFAGDVGRERYERLVHFAERQIRAMHWCVPTTDGSVPGGRRARDLVHETVQAVLIEEIGAPGRRDIPDDVDVGPALMRIIDSKLNHAAVGFENRRRADHVSQDRTGQKTDLLDSSIPFWDPSAANLTPDQLAVAASRCTRFIEFTKHDKIVCAILMLIRDTGIDRPATRVAKELVIKLAEVYTARKRMATLLRKFEKQETA